jgi:hypothetical protein
LALRGGRIGRSTGWSARARHNDGGLFRLAPTTSRHRIQSRHYQHYARQHNHPVRTHHPSPCVAFNELFSAAISEAAHVRTLVYVTAPNQPG